MTFREEVTHLARLALKLGEVERGLSRLDGKPETDTDHSVMITWVACSIAREYYPDLDLGLIAEFAVVHDAVEVYAGDTYAPTAGEEGRRKQKEAENRALYRIWDELGHLDWLPRMIDRYEQHDTREARFVRLVDKIVAKVVLRLDTDPMGSMIARGTTPADVAAYRDYENTMNWDEFPVLRELKDTLNTSLAGVGAV